MRRWLKERQARREVEGLRKRVLGHWAAVGIDSEWTPDKHEFFLSAARSRRGLTPEGKPQGANDA